MTCFQRKEMNIKFAVNPKLNFCVCLLQNLIFIAFIIICVHSYIFSTAWIGSCVLGLWLWLVCVILESHHRQSSSYASAACFFFFLLLTNLSVCLLSMYVTLNPVWAATNCVFWVIVAPWDSAQCALYITAAFVTNQSVL